MALDTHVLPAFGSLAESLGGKTQVCLTEGQANY